MNLLIFKVNQLGDNVVFLPIVQTLRRLYPQLKIRLMTSPLAAPLYEADVDTDSLMAIPTHEFNGAWKKPKELLSLTRLVRREKVDATLLSNDQGNAACLLAFLSGARIRAGADVDFLKARFLLTDRMPIPRNPSAARWNWEIAGGLVKQLGFEHWPENPSVPDLSHLLKDTRRQPRRIVIHPWASQPYQRWSLESYAALANRLSEKFEVIWMNYGEAAEIPLTTNVQRVRPADIHELCQWIGSASLFIGNNSGPMNLAFALGTPNVIINGPSHRMWDSVWFPERSLMLRDRTLTCSPCDSALNPQFLCLNKETPMTCMMRWDVPTVTRICSDWHEQWNQKDEKICADF